MLKNEAVSIKGTSKEILMIFNESMLLVSFIQYIPIGSAVKSISAVANVPNISP